MNNASNSNNNNNIYVQCHYKQISIVIWIALISYMSMSCTMKERREIKQIWHRHNFCWLCYYFYVPNAFMSLDMPQKHKINIQTHPIIFNDEYFSHFIEYMYIYICRLCYEYIWIHKHTTHKIYRLSFLDIGLYILLWNFRHTLTWLIPLIQGNHQKVMTE